MNQSKLACFPAPADGSLAKEMLAAYDDAGVLILENFVSKEACGALRQRSPDLPLRGFS